MSAVSPLRAAEHSDRESPAPARVAVLESRGPTVLAGRILHYQATVIGREQFAAGATAFATELASSLRCARVASGLTDRGRTRVVATSHTADFEAGAALFAQFTAAMDEAIDQGGSVSFPQESDAPPLITLAHAALARRYGGSAWSVPLVNSGRIFGALTLVRSEGEAPSVDERRLCEHLACLVGPVLELKHESERSWHSRLRVELRRARTALLSPGHASLKLGGGVALGLLLAALFIPVSYRVGAPARVEGAVQRALVAPADGFLRQVHVRPGDRVKADQVVAELAEEDLRLEQRKWESELTQHENAASAALARADRAQYVIHQSRADEARAQLDLAEKHLSRTRVTAPFDGVVIKGDLSQSTGAPLRRGDVLLTVAPNDRFRLLIEVDERDVPHVVKGARGEVALGAITDRSLPFEVSRVTPVSGNRDGRNFFEVEGEFAGAAPLLRPGLQGVARIEAGARPFAWIWTHRLFDWLRLQLWSWGL